MSCHEYDPAIERLLAEEIGDGERDRLLAHTEGCAACREFVDLHYRLQEPDWPADLPGDGEFAAMRRTVLTRIREREVADGSSLRGLRGVFAALWLRPALAAGFAVLVLAALGAGFLAGRGTAPQGVSLGAGDAVIAQMAREAAGHRGLADVENSPFSVSNVRLQQVPSGEIAMGFDVTRRVEFVRTMNDPLVQEVLAQSLVNPSSVGTRLEAMSYAGGMTDPRIEQALIHAMLNDENLAVRMRALGILRGHPRSAQLDQAFMMVLSGDGNVELRMQALDWLAAGDLTRERFDEVMGNLQVQDEALQVQAARYAERWN